MPIMSDLAVAPEVRRKVLHSRSRFWRPVDFTGSPDAVAKSLSRLTAAGEILRVRRGLYWRGVPTRLGMAPPPPDRIVAEVVTATGAGPAGWTAALALGLSTQVPRHETIAVPGRAPRNSGTVRFVSRAASLKRRDERLRPTEVALLEVLRDWETVVGVPREIAVQRVASLVESEAIRLDRVVRASATEPPMVRERLRHLLNAIDRTSEAAKIRPARRALPRHNLAATG